MLDLSHDLHVIFFWHLVAPRDSCRHYHLQTPKWRMDMDSKLGPNRGSFLNPFSGTSRPYSLATLRQCVHEAAWGFTRRAMQRIHM